MSYRLRITGFSEKNGGPFIGPLLPFVCHKKPLIVPFIYQNKPFIRKERFFGFTLLEMLTAIVILGILVSIAVPSMQGFVLSGRIKSQAGDLAAALSLARSEAIKRSATVSICIGTSSSCTGSNWANGWLVWADSNDNLAVDSGETILRTMAMAQSNVTITGSSSTTYIKFYSNGSTDKTATFSFQICDSIRTGETGRQIDISVLGKVNVNTLTCS